MLPLRVRPVHLLGCIFPGDLPSKLSFLGGYPALSNEDLGLVDGRDRILRGLINPTEKSSADVVRFVEYFRNCQKSGENFLY